MDIVSHHSSFTAPSLIEMGGPSPITSFIPSYNESSSITPSEKPRQSLCSLILGLFKRVLALLFGPKKKGVTSSAQAVDRNKTDTVLISKDVSIGGNVTPTSGKKPLELCNFGSADANVCWLNSLTQIFLSDEGLLNEVVQAAHKNGYPRFANHLIALSQSHETRATVNTKILFEEGGEKLKQVIRHRMNDPVDLLMALIEEYEGDVCACLFFMPKIDDRGVGATIETRGREALQKYKNHFITHQNERSWPPTHLLFITRKNVEVKNGVFQPNKEELQSLEKIRELIQIDSTMARYFDDGAKARAETLLDILLKQSPYPSLKTLYSQIETINEMSGLLRTYMNQNPADPSMKEIAGVSKLLVDRMGQIYTKQQMITLIKQVEDVANSVAYKNENSVLLKNLQLGLQEVVKKASDEIPLLKILHTLLCEIGCPGYQNDYPSSVGELDYEFFTWAQKKFPNLYSELNGNLGPLKENEDSRPILKSLNGVKEFLDKILDSRFSIRRELIPRLPLPKQTEYTIDGVRYELKGIVKHSNISSSAQGGHYTALVHPNKDGPAFYCNDSSVQLLSNPTFLDHIASGNDAILYLKKIS